MNNVVMFAVPENLTTQVTNLIRGAGNQTIPNGRNTTSQRQNGQHTISSSKKKNQGQAYQVSSSKNVGNNINQKSIGTWNQNQIQQFWNQSSKPVRKILKYLATRPNQDVTAEEIVKNTNLTSPYQVAEILGRFRSETSGENRVPFLRRFQGRQVQYMVPREIAQQINRF